MSKLRVVSLSVMLFVAICPLNVSADEGFPGIPDMLYARLPEPPTQPPVRIFIPREGSQAFSPTQPDTANEGSGGGCDNGDTSGTGMSAGNPVIIATGNKVETEVDFAVDSGDGLGLARHYNRQPADGGSFGGYWRASFDHRLGFAWNDTSEICAYMQTPGLACNESRPPDYVLYFDPDGARITYTYSGGRYVDAKGSPFSYIEKTASGGWLLRTEDFDALIFDAKGNIQSRKDRHGVGLTWSYPADKPNRASSLTGTSGKKIQITWSNDRISQITDPASGVYSYSYTGNGLLSAVTYPGGTGTRSYHYEHSGQPSWLTGVSVNGVRYSTFAYYGDGRTQSTQHAGGAELTQFTYGTSGSDIWTEVTGAGGARSRYTYRTIAGKRKLVSTSRSGVSNCPDVAASTVYDANGYPDYSLDFKNTRTDYAYAANGQLTEKLTAAATADARKTRYSWDTSYNRLIRVYTYDAVGLPLDETYYQYYATSDFANQRLKSVTRYNRTGIGAATARVASYTYSFHTSGMPKTLTEDGPLPGTCDRRILTYSASGQLTQLQIPDGSCTLRSTTYAGHNGLGLPGSVTDFNGFKTTFGYDARGRTTSRQQTLNSQSVTTQFSYDGFDHVLAEKIAGVEVASRSYDAAGRLVNERYTASDSIFRNTARNALGLPLTESNTVPNGSTSAAAATILLVVPLCRNE
jgi:YD repeat-containing protein